MKNERSLNIETSILQRTLAISGFIINLILLVLKNYPTYNTQLFYSAALLVCAIISLFSGLFLNKKTKFIQIVLMYLVSIILIFLAPYIYIGEVITLTTMSITIYYYSEVKRIFPFTFTFGIIICIVARYLSYQYNSLPVRNVIQGYIIFIFLVSILLSIMYNLKGLISKANKKKLIVETEHKIATSLIGVLHATGNIASLKDYNKLIQENISNKEIALSFLKQERMLIDEYSNKIKGLVSSYSSSFKANREIIEIGELLNQSIVFIETLRMKDRNVMINFERISLPLYARVNVSGIKTALENIINNSYDELVRSDVKSKKINITLLQDDENIKIIISDNGSGLKDYRGHVPYSYFKPGKTTKSEGTGLGMYIAIEEILSNEGQLDISSTSSGLTTNITLKKIRENPS